MSQETKAGAPASKTFTTVTGVVITHRQLIMVMVGVMLGILLSALDSTVVGPAMFKIIKDLKGLEHYAWVTTAYLFTSTVTVPIFGKLGDLYGRKWLFVGGMVVFMIGSALSGLSSGTADFNLTGSDHPRPHQSAWPQLIFFRAFQGIGGGYHVRHVPSPSSATWCRPPSADAGRVCSAPSSALRVSSARPSAATSPTISAGSGSST